ncbi:hypothetical protein BRD12_03590, partial [Halobacteriales archaeon SW_12_67_38]
MKLHPLSLPLRAIPRGANGGVLGLFLSFAVEQTGIVPTGSVVTGTLLFVAGFALGAGYEAVYYRRFEYDLTADTLDIGSGVLSRREREIPLRRIQNVDISRGMLQRALSIAVVDVETAGGGQTEASLRYVSYDEAELLFALSPRNLVLLGLVAPDLRALLPVLFFAVPTVGLSIPDLLTETGALTVGPRGAALAIVSWVGTAAVTAARYYDFQLSRVGDELRYERGLLGRYDG